MQLFYTTHQEGDFLILEGEEAHHCANVLRHQAGHQINVTNGKGSLFHCTIIDKTKTTVRLMPDSEQKFDTPAHLNLSIAIAPTKNIDRFEWFVEKALALVIEFNRAAKGEAFQLISDASEATLRSFLRWTDLVELEEVVNKWFWNCGQFNSLREKGPSL
ncbi:MAG TPA: RsmE family RNA methyltransferase [Saprospiraceae bacterium]|nr:RsmE family RNA methyltransferase [Saprospiraceae bacterium]